MPHDATSSRLVLTTVPDERVARELARALVERRLVACVNIVPGVVSMYRWQGALEESGELLLVMKTTAERMAELERVIHELHPYEVPSFVALEPRHVSAAYMRWVDEATASTA